MFNRLASVPLYKRIISDEFSSLCDHHGSQAAHPDIPSKTNFLHLTTALHLEYSNKSACTVAGSSESSYTTIMTQGPRAFQSFGRTQLFTALLLASREIDVLLRGGVKSPAADRHMIRFPALTTLTIGAVLGGQDEVWRKVMLRMDCEMELVTKNWAGDAVKAENLEGAIIASHAAMIDIFCRSPLTQFCQRGFAGPLSLPQTFHWVDRIIPPSRIATNPPQTKPLFTIHYNVDLHNESLYMQAAIGSPTRWLLERPIPSRQFGVMSEIFRLSFCSIGKERGPLWLAAKTSGRRPEHPTLDLSIYGSSVAMTSPSYPTQEEDEREFIAANNQAIRSGRFTGQKTPAGVKDSIVWRPIRDCPSCVACGWDFDYQAEPRT